jgi:hypothetical protein
MMAGNGASDEVVAANAVVPEGTGSVDPLAFSLLFPAESGVEAVIVSLEVGLASVGTASTDVPRVWDAVPETSVLGSVLEGVSGAGSA